MDVWTVQRKGTIKACLMVPRKRERLNLDIISVETVFQKENMMKYVLMKYLFIAEHHR